MKSREEIENEKRFMEILAYLRPDLWSIEAYRQSLELGDIEWLKDVMKAVFNTVVGSGYGEVVLEIRGKKLIRIRGTEMTLIEKDLF